MTLRIFAALPALLVCLSLSSAHADTPPVRGAGSSAAKLVYQAWSEAFARDGGSAIDYAAVGSSKGLKAIQAREVDFGASDVAPAAEVLTRDGLVVIPTVVSGVAPIVNLPELNQRPLRLDGPTLAAIFMGEVTRWNDPAIRALNPGAALPAAGIRVVTRSDGSGTTYNFTDYLNKVSPAWKARFGANTAIAWPDAVIPAKGSGGVVAAVGQTPGAIGYVDYTYVLKGALRTVEMKNSAGRFVSPSIDSFRAALNASAWHSRGDFSQTLTEQPGAESWPITMGTFVLLPKVMDEAAGVATLRFFTWAFMHGDELASLAHFVRLPDGVQAKAYRALATITSPDGAPIAYASLGQ
ncbi:phosphate ABC transporter substrate-binding protein PstS [Denitromonas iodatirespirans]|uniref:Phosphate-binding protein PstS n=1 Tax=Denitromonas iodatirespirans TaxID=2795389 RepID=A0A944DCK6_DENI1|nr:phosphate ABC transporter substrate-binding protein PstS [Denitromonas iodatirespirans]MBT0963755.1 phosphate ABC transporter substrate-binding protein PstS [Denitromonas iodatirespirans]